MITELEFIAFKSHLVAKGEVKHPSVLVNHVKRNWQDILEAGEPELLPDGKFDAILRAALEDFVRHRATPTIETVNEMRARPGLMDHILRMNVSVVVGRGYRDVEGCLWRIRRCLGNVNGHAVYEGMDSERRYTFLANGICRETPRCNLVEEVAEGT